MLHTINFFLKWFIEWNKYKILGRRRKQWKKCVSDIISDTDLTSSSLDSKEAFSYINNVFNNSQVGWFLECVRRIN